MIALTATGTKSIREDVISKLEMSGCVYVSVSPNRSNIIYYEVRRRDTIESDFAVLVESLRLKRNKAERVIVYSRSRNLCADLYQYFHDSR